MMICMERITLIIKLGDVQADVNNNDKKSSVLLLIA